MTPPDEQAALARARPAAAAASAFGNGPDHVEHGNVTGPEEKAAVEPAADELAAPAGPGPSPSAAAQQVRLRQERRNARETLTKQALRDQANLPDVLIGIVRAYHCPELDCTLGMCWQLLWWTSSEWSPAVTTQPSSCGTFAVAVACKR